MRLLVIAGAVAVLAGGVAIWFGIPVKEFSFGNTMILAGSMAICSGLLLIGLGLVVRELKAIKRSLRETVPAADPRETDGPLLPAGSIAGRGGRADRDAFDMRERAQEARIAPENAAPSSFRRETVGAPAAVHPDMGSDNFEPELAPPTSPPVKGRRNLLFSSSRSEREKARAGSRDAMADHPAATASAAPTIGSAAGRGGEPHSSFNDAPGFNRASAPVERSSAVDPPSPPAQEAPAATVVKSGAVNGMAYSLYSDGSIEAQMPEGMMRFKSIEHLRTHLDRDR